MDPDYMGGPCGWVQSSASCITVFPSSGLSSLSVVSVSSMEPIMLRNMVSFIFYMIKLHIITIYSINVFRSDDFHVLFLSSFSPLWNRMRRHQMVVKANQLFMILHFQNFEVEP